MTHKTDVVTHEIESVTKPAAPYLYPRFRPRNYDYSAFAGPRAGEPAIDMSLTDSNGKQIRLSGFRGKWVVIETASATCSMYTKNIPGMKALRQEFPDVEFIVVYVREAHPGERLGQHKTDDDKKSAALLLKNRYREDRRILIDSLEGDMHRAYGAMPNIVYIINPEGFVHYRCNWATVDGVRKALSERSYLHSEENADMMKLWKDRNTWNSLRTMWTGGLLALWDFMLAVPYMIQRHKEADKAYERDGQFHG